MVAVVLQAIWNLFRTAVKTRLLALIGTFAIVGNAFGLNVLLVLFAAGIVTVVARQASVLKSLQSRALAVLLPSTSLISSTGTLGTAAPFGLLALFLFFLKVGAVLFGSGYVLLAFLRTDLVLRLHWLTDKQLLDAIAVGQVTPGPVFTTATFIGYLLGRVSGAVVATVGIFLPSFLLIAIIGPLVPRLRKSAIFSSFLDGVNVGALALMVVVTWYLSRAAIVDVTTGSLALLSFIALIRFKVNTTWLILAGAILGLLAGKGLG
jgi:chromate transporter